MVVKKILIIRFSSIGDIILTEPVVRKLRQLYPSARIDYLTKPGNSDLVRMFPQINNLLLWEDKIQLLKSIRSQKYDLVIDLHNKFNSCIVKYISGAKQILTYQKKHFLRTMIVKKLARSFIDSTTKHYFSVFRKLNSDIYNEINNTDLLSADYYPLLNPGDISEKINRVMEEYQISTKKPLLAVFPGATHFTKQYPVDLWIETINLLGNQYEIVLMGGHQEKYQATRIRNSCKNKPIDLCGVFNLQELTEFLNVCTLIMTNDSGPMHIAAALKKPQIALFGATHTSLGFKPLNSNALIIQQNISCQPCSLHGGKECPKGHFKCMRSIKPEFLVQNIIEMLEKYYWKL